MRTFSLLTVVLLVIAFTNSSQAESAIPTDRVLQQMGLAELEVISDQAALSVRGRGLIWMNFMNMKMFQCYRGEIDGLRQKMAECRAQFQAGVLGVRH